jgi:AcrR family transcriptional regulator
MPAMNESQTPAERPDQRERILRAAFETFMEHGYANASTIEIARRAQVSKRDLYAQFHSKQGMLEACVANRAERMREPLALPVPRDQAMLTATLIAFGTTLLAQASRPEVLAVYRLAIMEAERAPEVARTLDTLGRTANHAALRDLLAGAQANGLLDSAGDPDEMAEAFLARLWSGGLLVQLLLRLAAPPDAQEAERRVRAAVGVLMGLYKGAAGPCGSAAAGS